MKDQGIIGRSLGRGIGSQRTHLGGEDKRTKGEERFGNKVNKSGEGNLQLGSVLLRLGRANRFVEFWVKPGFFVYNGGSIFILCVGYLFYFTHIQIHTHIYTHKCVSFAIKNIQICYL